MNIVVYTQRVEIEENYKEKRDCADQRIPEFLQKCSYLPIPLPNNAKIVKELIDNIKISGIVLTGGNSLVKYGGNAPERDEVDTVLIKYAIENKIPLYGFCRGMQSILDYFGNELINVKGHVAVRHKIRGKEDTTEVNSYHNQACIKLKNDSLEIVMQAEDGVIEKVKHKNLPIVGTMWHPEREIEFRNEDINLVKKLIGKE